MNGYCIKPAGMPTPHRMLRLSALKPEGLDLSDTKFIKVPDNIAERFSIRSGDVLICRSIGSYDMIAKCALAREDAPTVRFPDIIIRARCKPTLLPEFLRELIQSPVGRSHFQSNARTAVGMWKIGADDITDFPLPLPPLAEQRTLVARVALVRAEIARERAEADRLAAAIAAETEALLLGTKA